MRYGGMKKISGSTILYKKVLPAFFLGFLAFFAATAFRAGEKGDFLFALSVPLVMILFGAAFFRKMVWDLADKVYDNGHELVFRRGGKEQRVSLGDIVNISHSRMTSPERVEILVRTQGAIGKELAFIPPGRLVPFSKSPLVRDLIERVDRARNYG